LKKFSEESPLEYSYSKNKEANTILEERENEKDAIDEIHSSTDVRKINNKFGIKLISAVDLPSNSFSQKNQGEASFSNFMSYWSGKQKLGNRFLNEMKFNYNSLEDKFTCKSLSPLKNKEFISESFASNEKKPELEYEDQPSMKSVNVNNEDENMISSIEKPHFFMDEVKEESYKPIERTLKMIERSSEGNEKNLIKKQNSKKVYFFETKNNEETGNFHKLKVLKKKRVSQDDFLKISEIKNEVSLKRSASFEISQIKEK